MPQVSCLHLPALYQIYKVFIYTATEFCDCFLIHERSCSLSHFLQSILRTRCSTWRHGKSKIGAVSHSNPIHRSVERIRCPNSALFSQAIPIHIPLRLVFYQPHANTHQSPRFLTRLYFFLIPSNSLRFILQVLEGMKGFSLEPDSPPLSESIPRIKQPPCPIIGIASI